MQTFTAMDKGKTVPLKEGGEEIFVNEENKQEFCRLM